MDIDGINTLIEAYTGHLAVIFLAGLFWGTLKELTHNTVKGILLILNPNFNKYDHVEIDDDPAVIVHIGLTNTEFKLKTGPEEQSKVRVVANCRLSHIKLTRVLKNGKIT